MPLEQRRRRLMADLRREVRDEWVLNAIEATPREAFVPTEVFDRAYDNTPLPIGFGQTISQPLMVAIMVEAIQPKATDVVLDVGTGSGYQAAVLSRLVARVIGTERIHELGERARQVLWGLDYRNIAVVDATEDLGIPDMQFDAIIVGAASPSVPPSLLGQLKDGGRLVVPVGSPFDQNLARVTKRGADTGVEWLGPCRFVPLIGTQGWPKDIAIDDAGDA